MTRANYNTFLEDILDALLTGTVRAAVIDTDVYTPDLDVDRFLGDLPAGAVIATSAPLANKSVEDGVFDADDAVFSGITADEPIEDGDGLLLFIDTGDPATSRLVYVDDEATGLPLNVVQGTATVRWDDGPNKIFRLSPA